jgi:nucleoside-diphosphate-sugar epimerase
VIFAGSVMAVDGYPSEPAPLSADLSPRPTTLYGATKAWGEALGHYYATQYNLSVLCLRLGWVATRKDRALRPGSPLLPITLLDEDLLRLVIAALEAPADLRFGVFNGLSDNRVKRLDITETKRVLGYFPQADSFTVAAQNRPAVWRHRAGRFKRWVMKIVDGKNGPK